MNSNITLLVVFLGAASGFFFGNKTPDWSVLKATWGANPLSKEYFVNQPLTVDDAKKEGYQQVSTGCGGKFLGQRFIKGKDVGLVLIYDVQGTIAGVQMAIPMFLINEKYYLWAAQPMFNRDTINGTDVYVLTAYFIDPKTICQAGRNAESLKTVGTAQVEQDGSEYDSLWYGRKTASTHTAVYGAVSFDLGGSGLWLQNGTDPIRDTFVAPLLESDIVSTKWVKGACFPTMGVHYWYDNRLDTDCDTFFPAFLMYNRGKLTGFGWDTVGKYEYTKRTEFPPYSAISSFLKPVPTCMAERYELAGGFTTMHLYFTGSPLTLFC